MEREKQKREWFEAVRELNMDVLRQLAPRCHGMVDERGLTALWIVMENPERHAEALEAVRLLREYRDEHLKLVTQVNLAAFLGDTEFIQRQTGKALSPYAGSSYVNTALHHAAAMGHLDTVRALPASLYRRRNARGRSALMLACMRGHTRVAEFLAPHEQGMKDDLRRTALHYLLWSNKPGPAVDAVCRALEGFEDEIYNCIPALGLAFYRGDLRGPITSERGFDGQTALDYAVLGGHVRVVRCAASLFSRDSQALQSAFMLAVQRGDRAVARVLGECVCSLNLQRHWHRVVDVVLEPNPALGFLTALWAGTLTTTDRAATYQALSYPPAVFLRAARVDKTLGWLSNGRTLLELESLGERVHADTRKLLSANPLWATDIRLAARSALRPVREQREESEELDEEERAYRDEYGYRPEAVERLELPVLGVRRESEFNQAVFVAVRDAGALPLQRRDVWTPNPAIRAPLAQKIGWELVRSSYNIMFEYLTEVLAE